MSSEETWVLQTAELIVGSTLSFDLHDAAGVLLHKAGTPISDRLIERLQKRNIHSVTVKGRAADAIDQDSILFSLFDSFTIEKTKQIVMASERAIAKFTASLRQGEAGNVTELTANVNLFIAQTKLDSSVAFAVLASRTKSIRPEIVEKLTARSTLMSLIGVATSVVMSRSDADCIDVGMAGLLHDCSLLMHPEWFGDANNLYGNTKLLSEFRNHPIESAELLKEVEGVNGQVLEIISQVHEQFDGSGYPKRLAANAITNSARILNAADAYLNLVQPFFHNNRLLPADALAYLCHNATTGRFDTQVIRGFIKGMSIYPIGSIVELDDETVAMVVRSNLGKPLEPVVQPLKANSKAVDLSNSPRTIVGLNLKLDPSIQRIFKSSMDETLWRSDIGLEPAFEARLNG